MAGWIHNFFVDRGFAWMFEQGVLDLTPFQGLLLLLGIPSMILIGWFLSSLIRRFAVSVSDQGSLSRERALILHFQNSVFFIISMILLSVFLAYLGLSGQASEVSAIALRSAWVLTLAWFLYRSLSYVTVLVERRMGDGSGESWRIRGVRTQMIILRRVAGFIVVILAASVLLLQFEVVQKVGLSLLASAGVAGIVIGLAAQRSIASILYGIQLALTQPVRIGDTVVMEGEWGQIEEIYLTYVVVRIWDERRLIVPVERILNEPFENWTRSSPQILGSIFVEVDFQIPMCRLRESFEAFVKQQPLWDGRVCSLQVIELKEHSAQLRALVSAADASSLWDLRCLVREWFLTELASLDGGRYLPVLPIRSGASMKSNASALPEG